MPARIEAEREEAAYDREMIRAHGELEANLVASEANCSMCHERSRDGEGALLPLACSAARPDGRPSVQDGGSLAGKERSAATSTGSDGPVANDGSDLTSKSLDR